MKSYKKIIFWGTPLFALPAAQALFDLGLVSLVVTRPDKPAGRRQKLQVSPIKQWAIDNKLPVLMPAKFDQQFSADLEKYLPATFVVVAYGKIIPDSLLALSEKPAINIHPSLLPILRGPSPIQSALYNGLEETGVTLMQLDKEMDHGPILAQTSVKIESTDDFFSLSERLAKIGADLLIKNIKDYLAGQLKPQAQDDDKATYCQLLKKEDGEINWQLPAKQILNQIRAFLLWPTSFSTFGSLVVKIHKVSLAKQNLKPKEILISGDKLYIGTADQALEILEIQPANKKVLSVAEFIRGYRQFLA